MHFNALFAFRTCRFVEFGVILWKQAWAFASLAHSKAFIMPGMRDCYCLVICAAKGGKEISLPLYQRLHNAVTLTPKI
jgi:hypothetical protein